MPPLLVFYTLSHSSDTVYKESSTVSIRFILSHQNVKQIKFLISAYVKCMIGEFSAGLRSFHTATVQSD